MPRGKKICPSCNAECGPRSFKCKECDHPFIATSAPTAKPVKSTKEKAEKKPALKVVHAPEPEAPAYTNTGNRVLNITTPAGSCPCKPSELTYEGIKDWARRVHAYGLDRGVNYTPIAIAYWLGREFVDQLDDRKTFLQLKPACFDLSDEGEDDEE